MRLLALVHTAAAWHSTPRDGYPAFVPLGPSTETSPQHSHVRLRGGSQRALLPRGTAAESPSGSGAHRFASRAVRRTSGVNHPYTARREEERDPAPTQRTPPAAWLLHAAPSVAVDALAARAQRALAAGPSIELEKPPPLSRKLPLGGEWKPCCATLVATSAVAECPGPRCAHGYTRHTPTPRIDALEAATLRVYEEPHLP